MVRHAWLIAIALAVGAYASMQLDLSFGWVMLLVLSLPMIGVLVTLDDDLAGGWSNPDGTVAPPWVYRGFWGELLCLLSPAGLGFAIDSAENSTRALVICLLAVSLFALGRFLVKTSPRPVATSNG